METEKTKLKYTKPCIRLVKWSPQDSVCNQIISASLCITIEESTRADHFRAHSKGELKDKWTTW